MGGYPTWVKKSFIKNTGTGSVTIGNLPFTQIKHPWKGCYILDAPTGPVVDGTTLQYFSQTELQSLTTGSEPGFLLWLDRMGRLTPPHKQDQPFTGPKQEDNLDKYLPKKYQSRIMGGKGRGKPRKGKNCRKKAVAKVASTKSSKKTVKQLKPALPVKQQLLKPVLLAGIYKHNYKQPSGYQGYLTGYYVRHKNGENKGTSYRLKKVQGSTLPDLKNIKSYILFPNEHIPNGSKNATLPWKTRRRLMDRLIFETLRSAEVGSRELP